MEMFANHGSGMNLVSKMQGDPSDIMSSFPDHCNKVNIEIRRVTQVFRLPSACNIHCVKSQRRDWCWSWSSNTLATWCEKSTYWKRPWCWERLKAGEEGGDRGWDGITNSMDISLSKLQGTWCAAVHRVTKIQTWLSNWTTRYQTNTIDCT